MKDKKNPTRCILPEQVPRDLSKAKKKKIHIDLEKINRETLKSNLVLSHKYGYKDTKKKKHKINTQQKPTLINKKNKKTDYDNN